MIYKAKASKNRILDVNAMKKYKPSQYQKIGTGVFLNEGVNPLEGTIRTGGHIVNVESMKKYKPDQYQKIGTGVYLKEGVDPITGTIKIKETGAGAGDTGSGAGAGDVGAGGDAPIVKTPDTAKPKIVNNLEEAKKKVRELFISKFGANPTEEHVLSEANKMITAGGDEASVNALMNAYSTNPDQYKGFRRAGILGTSAEFRAEQRAGKLKELGYNDSLGAAPVAADWSKEFLNLKTQYKVDDAETKLSTLDQDIQAMQDSLTAGLYDTEGKLKPMSMIQGEQATLQRQGQLQINNLTRIRNGVAERVNTTYNTINNIMSLDQTDFTNAKAKYETSYNQNLNIQGMVNDWENQLLELDKLEYTLTTDAATPA